MLLAWNYCCSSSSCRPSGKTGEGRRVCLSSVRSLIKEKLDWKFHVCTVFVSCGSYLSILLLNLWVEIIPVPIKLRPSSEFPLKTKTTLVSVSLGCPLDLCAPVRAHTQEPSFLKWNLRGKKDHRFWNSGSSVFGLDTYSMLNMSFIFYTYTQKTAL